MKAPKIALAVVLCAASVAALAKSPPKYVPDISKLEQSAWRTACAFKTYDCSTLPAPQVWYKFIPGGVYGRYYHGAPGIEVNINLLGQPFSGFVMVHEMVHYIQNAQRLLPQPFQQDYGSHCARESEAFNITLAAAYAQGYSDSRLIAWPRMARRYGCAPTFRIIVRP